MRKYLVGAIAGVALAFSSQALAETISNVGKTVDAEYTVVVDGIVLDAKAIVVEGVSNTPNRTLGDAVGYDVAFRDNTVVFTKKEVETVNEVETEAEAANEEGTQDISKTRLEEVLKEGYMIADRVILLNQEWKSADEERKKEIDIEVVELKEKASQLKNERERLQAELEAQQ